MAAGLSYARYAGYGLVLRYTRSLRSGLLSYARYAGWVSTH